MWDVHADLALPASRRWQSRPFGVALLIAGVDENGPQLYHADPSGTFMRYDAKAIGSGSEGAQTELQDSWHKVGFPSSHVLRFPCEYCRANERQD